MKANLKKCLSPIKVWSLALGSIIGWGAYVMPGNTFLVKAGPAGTFIGLIIAAVILSIIVLNYHYMINKYPLAGGEVMYVDKLFGSKHAFWCAWFLSLCYSTLIPLNATALSLIASNIFTDMFQVGFSYDIAGYNIYLGEILLALSAIVIFGVLSIKGINVVSTMQVVFAILMLLGVFILSLAAMISPISSIGNLSPNFYPDTDPIIGVLSILVIAPWAFVGFDIVPQAVEEFNFSRTKVKKIMITAIFFGSTVYVLLNTITASVIPEGYNTWVEYIDDANNLEGLKSLPTFYAANELMGNYGLIFLTVSVLSAILSGLIGFYMAASRLLYSMSQMKILNIWFSYVHKKYKTPSNAILFIMLISLIAPFFGRTVLGWLVDMSSLGAAIAYGYTSATAYKTAKQEKEYIIIFSSIIGMIISFIFILLLLMPIPVIDCSLGKESYLCLVIWILTGMVFYNGSYIIR